MSNYEIWSSTLENKIKPISRQTKDYYPFHNRWRNNPLSDLSIIQPNIAGYYPYKTEYAKTTTFEKPFEYKWQYVCSTIFPVNPSYTAKPEPILFR